MLVQLRKSLALLVLASSGSAPLAAEETAQTADFSLQLEAARTLPDYFPLGVVRGDPALSVEAGFSQVQDAVMVPGFEQGTPYPAPSPYQQDPWGLRYFSLALAADSVARKRDELDLFDAETRALLQDYARAHVRSRVAAPVNARIHLWGLDNEWEAPPPAGAAARAPFLAWLRAAYAGDIAGLNEAWGTQYSAFDDSVVADLPVAAAYRTRPGAVLDWYAFATEHFLQLLLEQARATQEADPRRRGVVHKATQLTIDRPETSRARLFDHGRFAEIMRPYSAGLYGVDMYGSGDRQAYETSYLYNSIRPQQRKPGYGVLLTETNNHAGPAHQFASTFWRLLANGAKGMMFFTQGNLAAPARSDWNYYGMRNNVTGRFSARWYYAARLAAAIHRSERFWSQAVPAADLPRIALLQPRRDVLLAESSGRDPAEGRFAYARNERWLVYRRLREQGYWVDILPYEKLTDAYLRAYDALLLVGAEHLSAAESATVLRYVESGGVAVGDTLPGYYDAHHRVRNTLGAAAKVDVTREARVQGLQFDMGGMTVSGVTQHSIAAAEDVLARDTAGQPRALLRNYGAGRILLLPFELGSLRPERRMALDDAGHIGAWLADLLRRAGVEPAYAMQYASAEAKRILRVEQPFVDTEGNVAVVVSTRAQERQETVAAGSIDMPLPGGPWTQAWWAAAGSNALMPVPLSTLEGALHRIEMPAVDSAGILYLFKRHAPLLGFGAIQAATPVEDANIARVRGGEPFTLPVQIVNASAATLAPGNLRLQAPGGWAVEPRQVATAPLKAGASRTLRFSVTPPAGALASTQPYSLLAHWSEGENARAVMSMLVELEPAEASMLLSGNAAYSAQYPQRLDRRATYHYLAPAAELIDDPASAGGARGQPTNKALTNGFGSIGGERNSFNRGGYVQAHYARYRGTEAEIIFDLRTARQINRIQIVKGPERVTPLSVETYTSVDGDEYFAHGAVKPEATRLETAIGLPQVNARYVKLRIVWPAAGGTLDEVEIWGQ